MKYKYNNEWNTITKDGAPGKDGTPGKDGKSAYEYAKQGGYTGTEEEFAEKLAEEIDVSEFMSKTNPTGTGSFSLNRKAGTVIGNYSHAEGFNTTASRYASHAEGRGTIASGDRSHAEGFNTTASGNFSHAEGNATIASVICSHAEGAGTTAQGNYSHAEGRSTIASGNFSHVQGKYNIADFSSVYADIIGNGTSASNQSNAATVDWSGNAWYAGNVYVGSTSGTNKDEGSKKLATEEYVDNKIIVPVPSSADEEKVLRVVGGKATWVSLLSASGVSF